MLIRIPEPIRMRFFAEFGGEFYPIKAVVTDRTPVRGLIREIVFVGAWGETSPRVPIFIVPEEKQEAEDEQESPEFRAYVLQQAMDDRGYERIDVVKELPRKKKRKS